MWVHDVGAFIKPLGAILEALLFPSLGSPNALNKTSHALQARMALARVEVFFGRAASRNFPPSPPSTEMEAKSLLNQGFSSLPCGVLPHTKTTHGVIYVGSPVWSFFIHMFTI